VWRSLPLEAGTPVYNIKMGRLRNSNRLQARLLGGKKKRACFESGCGVEYGADKAVLFLLLLEFRGEEDTSEVYSGLFQGN